MFGHPTIVDRATYHGLSLFWTANRVFFTVGRPKDDCLCQAKHQENPGHFLNAFSLIYAISHFTLSSGLSI